MDVLSTLMREMRFGTAGYCQLRMTAPWAVSFDQKGLRGIHIILRGECELVFPGSPPTMLRTGDLVVTPSAEPHVLNSRGAAGIRPTHAFPFEAKEGEEGAGETVILCGAFVFEESDHFALSALPRLIHVQGDGVPAPWLAAYIGAISAEAEDSGPGSEVVMARLSDALVARALRFHAAGTAEAGWLKAIADPRLARVMAALHERPEERWTVAGLAKLAALSRAAFAARFTEAVGESPMHYLLRLRMRRATAMLRDGRATLAEIASETGYGSEAALSAAFIRAMGSPPGAWRKQARLAEEEWANATAERMPDRGGRDGTHSLWAAGAG